jgi:hypothetical protein
MVTVSIISLIWGCLLSFYSLAAKWTGINVFGVLIVKFLSAISLIYFCSELIKLIP